MWRRLRRRRPLSAAQREVLAARVWDRYALTDEERASHAERVADLVARLDWEAAHGFALTDEMPVVVAGLAALLALHLEDPDPYRHVTAVVLHPSGMPLHGSQPGPSAGVVIAGPRHVQGHTAVRGPVHLSWRTIQREAAAASSRNLVLHEFAHQLDMGDAVVDGTPPMADPSARQRWVDVCTAAYDDVRAAAVSSPLRTYATTNPGEFFAVATETFFERPADLQLAHPDLYDVLRRYFGHDPASRAA